MESVSTQLVWLVVVATAVLGFIGLVIRLNKNIEKLDSIIWFMFSLAGASLIFTIFKDNSADGKLLGIKLGGPIAGMAFIWFAGYRFFKKDDKLDEKKKEIEERENALKKREQSQTIKEQKDQAPTAIKGYDTKHYNFASMKNKQIGIAIGNISEVQGIDIWVNSENIFMQMARFFDKSVSGIIRFMGAEKSKDGLLSKDTIAIELFEKAGHLSPVRPAQVFVTSSGLLEQTNGVKKIIHVAAVEAEPIVGFRPVQDIGRCIQNCLLETFEPELKAVEPKSIIFPLIGTGSGQGDKVETVSIILRAALSFLEKNPDSSLKTIYLLAYSNQDLNSCLQAIDLLGGKEA